MSDRESKRTARARRTSAGDREDRKAEASELLAAIRKAAGLTKAAAHDACGVSETKYGMWEDPEAPQSPAPLDAILADPLASHAVRALARRVGMVAVELPRVTEVHDDLRLLAEVQSETSDAVRAHLAAIADGVITRAENAECRREIREAIVALVRLDMALCAVEHEPCVAVRRTH